MRPVRPLLITFTTSLLVSACKPSGAAESGADASLNEDAFSEDAGPYRDAATHADASPHDASDTESEAGESDVDAGDSTTPDSGPDAGEDVDHASCTPLTIAAEPASRSLLLVLDRSGSMSAVTADGPTLWDNALGGIESVLSRSASDLEVGLMTFPAYREQDDCSLLPTPDQFNCYIANAGAGACDVGSIDVEPAAGAGPSIVGALRAMGPNGATPTAATLEAARKHLLETGSAADVLLITDGAPNCSDGTSSTEVDGAAVAAALTELETMAADSIRTYVLGFSRSDAQLAQTLDSMAVAGGSGDTTHRSVVTQADVERELEAVLSATGDCTFTLTPSVAHGVLHVEVDGEEVGPDGWSLSAGGTTLRLLQTACAALTGDAASTLSLTTSCP
jgi:Mg-chelatase subunit ChlD